ncbi:sensor histidine kinase [Nocardia sp. NPDC055002]
MTAAGLVTFGALTATLLDRGQLDRVDAQLDALTTQLVSADRPPPPPMPDPAAAELPSAFRILFFDNNGHQVGQLGDNSDNSAKPELPPMNADSVRKLGDGSFTVSNRRSDAEWRVRAGVQLPNESQPDGGTVAVAMSLEGVSATTKQLHTIEIVAGTVLLGAAVLAAIWLVRLGLIPLSRIEDTADAITAGNLDRRVVDTDPHTEVGRLGSAFNVMLSQISEVMRQLANSEHRMRMFVSDASHELRTPLTTIRGYSELFRVGGEQAAGGAAEMMRRIEGESLRMSALVDDLLLLANLDQERPLDLAEVDLATLIREISDTIRAQFPQRHIELVSSVDQALILADERRIRQVVNNLVNNALVHTPPTAAITIAISYTPAQPTIGAMAAAGATNPQTERVIVLGVSDDGPGISQADAPYIFDRFFQTDRSRSISTGSGLGLSIVASILNAHGARIELLANQNRGATFRILFPAV